MSPTRYVLASSRLQQRHVLQAQQNEEWVVQTGLQSITQWHRVHLLCVTSASDSAAPA